MKIIYTDSQLMLLKNRLQGQLNTVVQNAINEVEDAAWKTSLNSLKDKAKTLDAEKTQIVCTAVNALLDTTANIVSVATLGEAAIPAKLCAGALKTIVSAFGAYKGKSSEIAAVKQSMKTLEKKYFHYRFLQGVIEYLEYHGHDLDAKKVKKQGFMKELQNQSEHFTAELTYTLCLQYFFYTFMSYNSCDDILRLIAAQMKDGVYNIDEQKHGTDKDGISHFIKAVSTVGEIEVPLKEKNWYSFNRENIYLEPKEDYKKIAPIIASNKNKSYSITKYKFSGILNNAPRIVMVRTKEKLYYAVGDKIRYVAKDCNLFLDEKGANPEENLAYPPIIKLSAVGMITAGAHLQFPVGARATYASPLIAYRKIIKIEMNKKQEDALNKSLRGIIDNLLKYKSQRYNARNVRKKSQDTCIAIVSERLKKWDEKKEAGNNQDEKQFYLKPIRVQLLSLNDRLHRQIERKKEKANDSHQYHSLFAEIFSELSRTFNTTLLLDARGVRRNCARHIVRRCYNLHGYIEKYYNETLQLNIKNIIWAIANAYRIDIDVFTEKGLDAFNGSRVVSQLERSSKKIVLRYNAVSKCYHAVQLENEEQNVEIHATLVKQLKIFVKGIKEKLSKQLSINLHDVNIDPSDKEKEMLETIIHLGKLLKKNTVEISIDEIRVTLEFLKKIESKYKCLSVSNNNNVANKYSNNMVVTTVTDSAATTNLVHS
ncbi:MAG: hypothetical protein COB50_02500 [Thiotrichales bacterium]|nr:MAG: hypothetical protein COB50_02500 [Thiotrichales bacterium]